MVISTGAILTIILLVLLIGSLPSWPHSKSWGYGPSGILSTVLIIIVIMMVLGRL